MKQEEKALQTKLALANALKKKMTEKVISKVTVRELIEACNLNRKTFYYHFEDIYALLQWMLEQDVIEVVQNFDLLLNLEDAIEFVMQYVAENKHILNCALDGIGREGLKRFFVADFHKVIGTQLKFGAQKLGITIKEDYERFLTLVYTEAIAGMLVEWIQAKSNREVSYITSEHIAMFIRTSLPPVLMAAAQNQK